MHSSVATAVLKKFDFFRNSHFLTLNHYDPATEKAMTGKIIPHDEFLRRIRPMRTKNTLFLNELETTPVKGKRQRDTMSAVVLRLSSWHGIGNIKRVLHELSESMPKDKPLLVTEIGAEAIYGFRDPLKARRTEEYQAELLEQCCDYALSDEECADIAIRQFADTRSYVTGPNIYARSRGFNNKEISG